MSEFASFVISLLRTLTKQITLPEDYELSICLTDKNNIVIHQEIKTLEGYKQEDVTWIINEIKNFANEEDKEVCREVINV